MTNLKADLDVEPGDTISATSQDGKEFDLVADGSKTKLNNIKVTLDGNPAGEINLIREFSSAYDDDVIATVRQRDEDIAKITDLEVL